MGFQAKFVRGNLVAEVAAPGGFLTAAFRLHARAAGAGLPGRVTWCYVTDPEGNVLELQAWS
ncbi:MAG: hypothetical protein P4L39_11360 [Humidesulfovibrio sp.]|nr:hypothetical protein [Humidesulfovibrio sp.]